MRGAIDAGDDVMYSETKLLGAIYRIRKSDFIRMIQLTFLDVISTALDTPRVYLPWVILGCCDLYCE